MESLSPSSILLLFCSSKSRGLTQMHFKWAIYRVDIQPGIVPQNSSFILGHGLFSCVEWKVSLERQHQDFPSLLKTVVGSW